MTGYESEGMDHTTTQQETSTDYRYTEIDSSEIRCVSLSLNEARHTGQLSVYPRDGSEYCALSYEWGNPITEEDSSVAIVRDDSAAGRIYVTRKLDNALSDLKRSSLQPNLLFIDQISINQDDNQEKSVHVACMGEVYECAMKVVVYLGPEEDGDR